MNNPEVVWVGNRDEHGPEHWILTRDQKPTRKDANQDGCVLAAMRYSLRDKQWRVRFIDSIEVRTYPLDYPLWIPAMKNPNAIKGLE